MKETHDTNPESDFLTDLYRTMVTIRAFELKVKELVQLNLVGGAAHLSIGQEAVATGVCRATESDDQVLSTHRGHGHLIAKGADVRRMFAEILGRETGYSSGKGGSMHIADPEIGVLGANGIVGGGITIATGVGLALKLRKTQSVCVCFFGDGAATQGGLHEALNICSLWSLPVLYICENNQYAMSNPVARSLAIGSLAEWARAYGVGGASVDGNDVREVYQTAGKAMDDIRNGAPGYLLECVTYRQEGHYCGDPAAYRDNDEVRQWVEERDPINSHRRYLLENGVEAELLNEIDSAVTESIEKAAGEGLNDPEPGVDVTTKDVFIDLWSQRDISSPDRKSEDTVEITYRDAARRALDEEMARDERVVILGEDIDVHGGAFQVTKGLYEKYGPDRVLNTPISEAVIGGCTLGCALAGLRPVGEFMYSDFMTLAMDQIVNQTAKVRYMFGGRTLAPLVYRAACGSGGRGNAAQHSQSLEAWFMHVPGLKVVMPATPFDMVGLLKTAIRDDDPVVFLEHKAVYNIQGPVPRREYLLPFGRADIKRAGSNLTLVATGRMVLYCLEAAEMLSAEGISVEVVDPRTLVPLDRDTICESVRKTGFAVVVSEDCITAGVSAEISSVINEEVFDDLDHPVVRVAAENVPIPYNRTLEHASVPSVDSICRAVRQTLGTDEA